MKRAARLTIAAAAHLFIQDRRAQGFKPKTIIFYTDRLGMFARWCEGAGIVALEEWTPTVTRRYFASLIDAGYRQATMNTSGRALRTFAYWCANEGLTDTKPLRNVKIPAPPREILPALSPEAIAKLLAVAPDPRGRALVLFLLDSGLRVSELCALSGGDVDLATGAVQVRRGKGGKTRVAYISPATCKALHKYFRVEGYPEAEEAIWRSQTSDARLPDSGVRQALKTMAKEAGVKGVSPHAFRRTFAIFLLRQGMDVHSPSRLDLMFRNDRGVLENLKRNRRPSYA